MFVSISTFGKGRTSFVIAHRLSTIRDAAMILYMENGDIKEVGNYETLMAKGGKYADLYNSQFAWWGKDNPKNTKKYNDQYIW